MTNRWMRLSVVLGVVLVLAAGVWALGSQGPKHTFHKCPVPACTTPCDPSNQPIIVCQQGRHGSPFQSTFACCCCNENARDRYYYTE